MARAWLAAFAAAAAVCNCAGEARAMTPNSTNTPSYTISNINDPNAVQRGNYSTVVTSINNLGMTTGYYFTSLSSEVPMIFTEQNGNFESIDISNILGKNIYGISSPRINDSGVLVGSYNSGTSEIGFTLSGEDINLISSAYQYTALTGENNVGQLVGYVRGANGSGGIEINNGVMSIVDTGVPLTYFTGISDSGWISGDYSDGSSISTFIIENRAIYQIGVPNSLFGTTFLSGMSSDGLAVGHYNDLQNNTHSFFLDGDVYYYFDVPGALDTDATGINDQGQIVGEYLMPGSDLWQSFLATPDSAPPPPDSLPPIPPSPTDVPEPATWMMLALGAGMIGALVRRRSAAVALAG